MQLYRGILFVLLISLFSGTAWAPPSERYHHNYYTLRQLNEFLWDFLQLYQLGTDEQYPEVASDEKINQILTGIIEAIQPSLPAHQAQEAQAIEPVRRSRFRLRGIVRAFRDLALDAAQYFGGVEPESVPVIWLFYPAIRERMFSRGIPLGNRRFLAQLRAFNGVWFTQEVIWENVVLRGLNFYGARICQHRFINCELNSLVIEHAYFIDCTFTNCILRSPVYDGYTDIQSCEVIESDESETNLLFLQMAGIPLAALSQPIEHIPFTSPIQFWFAANILAPEGADGALAQVDIANTASFIIQFVAAADNAIRRQLITQLMINYIAILVQSSPTQQTQNLLLQLRSLLALYFPTTLAELDTLEASSDLLRQQRPHLQDTFLSPQQQAYQQSLIQYLANHQISTLTTLKDDSCFYHALNSALVQLNIQTFPNGGHSAHRMRELIAGFILAFFAWQNNPDQVEQELHPKMAQLETILSESFSHELLEDILDEVTDTSTWAAQYSTPVIAVMFQHPVWLIHTHGPNVEAGITLTNGTSINEAAPAWAEAAGESIILIHDGVNHWLVGMLGLLIVSQEQTSVTQ